MEQQADNVEVAVEATDAPVSERPEWLPEKFKTPEDLASSYTALEQKLGAGQEELRNQLIQEFENAALESRPASVGDYEIPESIDPALASDNELFKWWADHAFENAYSQEEFADGIAKYAEFMMAQQPDLDAERAKLGDNADARIEAVSLWSQKFFPEQLGGAVETLGQSAEGIEALEFIMEQMGQTSVGASNAPINQMTEGDLRTMMNDERYWNPAKRDPSYVQRVQEGFSKLYR